MKKTILLFTALTLLSGCGLYGTSKYNNAIDIGKSDFSQVNHFKKGSSCSFLILGFIPWPWHPNKTPDTLLGAIKEAGINKVEITETTYDYHFLWANSCRNVYGL